MIRAVASLAALLLALAPALPAAAAQKDRITLGMVLEPPHLDPTQSPAAAIKEILYANVMEGLTRIDETGAVMPLLATSWTAAPDGLSYSFKLKEGVTFHDGTPFTSAGVKWNLERNGTPESANVLKRQLYANIAAVETPEPLSVTVRLKTVDYLLPYRLALGEAVLFSSKPAAEA